ncbi:MAG: putative porin [Bacteroidales bacterium]
MPILRSPIIILLLLNAASFALAQTALVDSDTILQLAKNDSTQHRVLLQDTSLQQVSDSLNLPKDSLVRKKERRLDLPKNIEIETIDTTLRSRVFQYTISRTTNDLRAMPMDTSLHYYRTDYPFLRNDVDAIFLGNLGSPVVSYNYFKRTHQSEFIFQQPYEVYFFSPENTPFFNSSTPYTILYYDWAGSRVQEESQLRVLHTQNIRHDLSYSILYNNLAAKGIYPRQRASNKAFNGNLSYLGKYYKANAGYIFNSIEAQESGGISDDGLILDTVVGPQDHIMRLENAKNHLRNHSYHLAHSLDLRLLYFGNDSVINNILMGRIGHTFEYSTYNKVYTDDIDTIYYPSPFFNTEHTKDSLSLRSIDNKFFLQLRPLRAYIFESLTFGVGYKNINSYMADSLSITNKLQTLYAYAEMSAWYKKYFKWNAFAESKLAGYQGGDYKFGGDLTLSFFPVEEGIHLNLAGNFRGTSPDVFLQNYTSNYYQWNNDFNRETELQLHAKVAIPKWAIELGVSNSLLNNYIYFGHQSTPQQHNGALSVLTGTLSHRFKWAGLHLHHRLLFQTSTNQKILPVPAFSFSNSYFYELVLIKNVLLVQLGIDWRYATRFNGYAYNPSIGMFHNADGKLGGYLWADAFLSFRWKRATPFIKYEHLTQGLIEGHNNYFAAVHYPRNDRVFKFGLSWKFFD